MAKRMGRRTLALENRPGIVSYAAVVGGKEGAGPLKKGFDEVSQDSYFGQDSWEKAETAMLGRCLDLCMEKAGGTTPALILGGDLLNQCVSSAFAVKDRGIPYLGLYGACSTMAEGLALAALLLDGGGVDSALAFTGSHFCAAERQYRFPLEYGGQRTPTSQWTVTGAGAALLSKEGGGLRITHATTGRVVDARHGGSAGGCRAAGGVGPYGCCGLLSPRRCAPPPSRRGGRFSAQRLQKRFCRRTI